MIGAPNHIEFFPLDHVMTASIADQTFADMLFSSTQEMFDSGQPLMNRVLPSDGNVQIWDHYPEGDVVNGPAGCRYFYHCHPVGERGEGEHGHFHLFFDKAAMPATFDPLIAAPEAPKDQPRANVVHIAALAISNEGLPIEWFGTNRWVTDEWLYPADAIIGMLGQFDLTGQSGDPLVNQWLTAMLGLSHAPLAKILHERDDYLRKADMSGTTHGEDRAVEITSAAPISLESLLDS